MIAARRIRNRGFSLIELVVVIVILGIIGAIAIPRMSRGATGAGDSGAIADLAVLRSAIDLYEAEHGAYPALATFVNQLTLYSDVDGNTSATKTGAFVYGPYLRKMPTQKVGPEKGSATLTGTQGTSGFGWWYDETSGVIKVNAANTDLDDAGTRYVDY